MCLLRRGENNLKKLIALLFTQHSDQCVQVFEYFRQLISYYYTTAVTHHKGVQPSKCTRSCSKSIHDFMLSFCFRRYLHTVYRQLIGVDTFWEKFVLLYRCAVLQTRNTFLSETFIAYSSTWTCPLEVKYSITNILGIKDQQYLLLCWTIPPDFLRCS